MSRRKLYAAVAGVVVLVAALTLGLVFGLSGGQPQSTESTQASLTSAGGPNEAIQVHGHWNIEVINPDGTLASRNEFDNDLVDMGKSALVGLLIGDHSAGMWMVRLTATQQASSPFASGSGWILDNRYTGTPSSAPDTFYTLDVARDPITVGVFTLTGTATATKDGGINFVATQICGCDASTAPSACTAFLVADEFTMASFNAVDVVAGQQILVQVTISFQ